MAGTVNDKRSPKNKSIKFGGFSNEVIKDSSDASPHYLHTISSSLGLRGVLGLGQSIEINKQARSTEKSWNHETLVGPNHLQQEQIQLIDSQQKDLKKEIQQLLEEIKKLAKTTDNLEKSVEIATLTPITEANIYQVNFLSRLKTFIVEIRKNVADASLWLDAFQTKKKKRNAFWNNVKNKKRGGEQYLFSNEHSAARSVS